MVRLDAEYNKFVHAGAAVAIGAAVAKFGPSVVSSMGAWQAGLITGVIALTAHATEEFFTRKNIMTDSPRLKKLTSYSIGMIAGGTVTAGLVWAGVMSAPTILGAAALTALAYGASKLGGHIVFQKDHLSAGMYIRTGFNSD